MALDSETIAALEAAKVAVQDYEAVRLAEIDDLAANLKAYGVALDSLSVGTTESATDEALATISTLLG